MNRRLSTIVLAAALSLPATAAGQTAIVIENATVIVEPGKVLKGASVLMRGGKIAAVGASVSVPAGATRINGAGRIVTAGLIEASSRLGLSEVSAVSATNEGSFSGGSRNVFASYRVADGFNDRSISIAITRTGGITTAVTRPTGAFISGIGSLIALGDSGISNATIERRDTALYINFGRSAIGTNSGSRGLAVTRLRELFEDARVLAQRRANYERNQTRAFSASRLDLATLDRVRTTRLPIIVRADRASDIRSALRLASDLGLNIAIDGGAEAWRVAPELAAAKVPVIVDPMSNLPSNFDRIQIRNDSPAVLVRAGVDVIISTMGSVMSMRNLRQRAGVGVAYGMTRDQALAAITTAPAKLFGLKRRGTLAVGNVADVVVWSGDPLELSSHVEHLFVGGASQSLRNRQTRLLERYRELKGLKAKAPATF